MQRGALNIAISEPAVRRGLRLAAADQERPARSIVIEVVADWLVAHGYAPPDDRARDAREPV
jgi:hypothetical protein